MVCPASAMVGGAQEIPAAHTQPEVMFVGSSGNFCTGVAIARDLVLTAAHCVHAGDSYKLVELDFNDKPIPQGHSGGRAPPAVQSQDHAGTPHATADVALMKLELPLFGATRAAHCTPRPRISAGERFCRARLRRRQFAATATSAGRLREAALVATGQPGNLQLRLVDPATGGTRPDLGACTGDFRRACLPGDAIGPRRDRRGELVDRPRTARTAAADSPA